MIVTNVETGCDGRERRQARNGVPDEAPVADGEAVWSRCLDAGIKLADALSFLGITPAMVARKPDHQGEPGISRKAIAQGRPDCVS